MTQKTNQFNLTTKRYTESDILSFIEKGYWIYTVLASDRFGDNGLTGLIVIKVDKENSLAYIDSLLLSCRILGKGIEEAFVIKVLNKLEEAGIKEVRGIYIKSSKNEQVESFYDRLGFMLLPNNKSNENFTKEYRLKLDKNILQIKNIYKIIE
jgi:FkbH-like protein